MTDRDNLLWLQFWRDRRTDFHQQSVNPLLIRFWPSLNLPRDSIIFVPLCGKSLDMLWLAAQGHQVIGVELSTVAVNAFFKENKLKPSKKRLGKFVQWEVGKLRILCGDYFSLTRAELGNIDSVYDRAALTALPEAIRSQYVSHLESIIPNTANIFLLTTEDAEENQSNEQALGINTEIKALYENNFAIDLAHVESIFETDEEVPELAPKRTEYKLYRLSRFAGRD